MEENKKETEEFKFKHPNGRGHCSCWPEMDCCDCGQSAEPYLTDAFWFRDLTGDE